MSEFPEVRVRFAPSPTGYLHVGGARSALFNYLFAKRHNGKFILRIEDTDLERSTEDSLKMMISDLDWLGLNWDEGVNPETLEDLGPHAPYRQSRRLELYKSVAETLLKNGKAYYCFMTDEEIELQKAKNKEENSYAHIESPYANWTLEQALLELAKGRSAVVRFKTQNLKKDYLLKDLIRGDVKFPSDMVGDFVLLRSDGMPVYNFCCVVDDHDMKISHVLRAEEHLPNTLRQMMIYEGMNWTLPEFGHISLVLDDDRQKLSKRKGAVACNVFREEGYLPEAMLNYLVLLGWSHPEGKEIFSFQEMKELFSLDRLNASGAVFDRVKLKWVNAQHLRTLPSEVLWKMIKPYLKAYEIQFPETGSEAEAWAMRSVDVFRPKLEILSDCVPLYKDIDESKFVIYDESDEILSLPTSKQVIETWKNLLSEFKQDYLTEADFVKIENEVKTLAQVKGKNLFMPMRVAVIGKPHGTELKMLTPLIHIKSLIYRADQVLKKMV